MSDEKSVEFLYSSLEDIRDTIRAIDIKLSFFLALILAPLAASSDIITTIIEFRSHLFFVILFACTSITWLFTVYVICNALSSIGNPAAKVEILTKSDSTLYPSGIYFAANLFDKKFTVKNSLVCEPEIKSSISYEAHYLKFQQTLALDKELVFEQMKLCYIRDIKIFRQQFIMKLIKLWGILAVSTVLSFILAIKH